MSKPQLKKQIGLATGIAFVVGGVIGMGAFVLIPLICSKAGAAAWMSISMAVLVSLLSVFPLIQLSAVFPVAGGGYEYGKRFFNPTVGIIFSTWALLGGSAAVALVAFGLVESFRAVVEIPFSLHLQALFLIVIFWGLFLSSTKTMAAMQVMLVMQMLAALLLYALPTIGAHWSKVVFSVPRADKDFFMSIIFSFNICLGFQMIIELGEDLKSPKRNIPLSLLIGGGIVWFIYMLVAAAYIGAVGVQHLSLKPEIVSTAPAWLPEWMIYFMRLGIISAGITCFVGAGVAMPREIFALARDKVLPHSLSRVNKQGTPQAAIHVFFALVCFVLILGHFLEHLGVIDYFFGKDSIEFYGFLTIFGIMGLGAGVSLASLRLQKVMPQELAQAYIRFHPWLLKFLVVVSVSASLFLMVLVSFKWIVPVCVVLVTFFALWMFKMYSKNKTLQ